MIEQVLAERFHAVVVDEPPMGRDPDEFVDRLIRRGRSRLAVGAALGVAVIATATVVVTTTFGGATPVHRAAAPPPPTLAPTSRPVAVTAHSGPSGTFEVYPVPLPDGATLLGFVLDQPGTDLATVQVRLDDSVLFEEDVAGSDDVAYRFAKPIVVAAGQVLAVAMRCWKSDGECRAEVTFSTR